MMKLQMLLRIVSIRKHLLPKMAVTARKKFKSKNKKQSAGGGGDHPPPRHYLLKVFIWSQVLLYIVSTIMATVVPPDVTVCNGLTFACINVNSMNMSSANKPI
jgi:hypothetical protein